ncbi:exopolyphosphatase [Actibacterium mucosum KCTC 23349]|uniref:Exopolyphosphatase n=2 Tax=Actibacterium TaxID=1433986 RepID=A0A037ZLJ3_9RHOB|nr:Ppx/GppA family phosphatase [Actibacterium mucosum]KAJ56509.1 exopolyphosphatase [Actibacterium mucosum KCTC 23349]
MSGEMAAEAHEDWGPFGEPIFESPSARALSRVGVVDVGSNSVRLVVFDGAARSPAYFFNEKLMCGLGAGLSETGRLNPKGRERALEALRRFALLAEGMGASPMTVIATAAMREAKDGPDFVKQVKKETGLRMWVIDGKEEARLTAQGVLLGWPGADGIVCDIGGSSMELAQVRDGGVGKRETSPLGPLKLAGVQGGNKAVSKVIRSEVNKLVKAVGNHRRLYLVGGSWRAIARLDMERRGYPLLVLHDYHMTPKAIRETIKWIGQNDLEELRTRTGTSATRMALVPMACEVLETLIDRLKPEDIFVSSYGVREGLLYEQMSDEQRRRDPLIEACQFAEASSSRIPGFGRRLYDFVRPVFADAVPEQRRLARAACLLHDTAWRAHPDYRHEVCFDNATRANLGGLDHQGRVFLGLALLHRYKNNREGTRFEAMFSLLDKDHLRMAETLGKAMRFGAMFTMKNPEQMATLHPRPDEGVLELQLSGDALGLFGEVAEARFQSLARAMDLRTMVTVTKAG